MRTATLCFALLPCAITLQAQASELQPGARVRLEAPGITAARFVGTVLSRTGDTLLVGGPNVAPVRVPVAALTSLEISRGSSRMEGAKRGLMWGVPIGLLFGGAVALTAQCDNCSSPPTDKDRTGFVTAMTVSGAVWGAGIGALVGRERWERFAVAAPRTSIDLRGGRATLAMALPR
jgi:hypothetical protein